MPAGGSEVKRARRGMRRGYDEAALGARRPNRDVPNRRVPGTVPGGCPFSSCPGDCPRDDRSRVLRAGTGARRVPGTVPGTRRFELELAVVVVDRVRDPEDLVRRPDAQ